MQREVIAAGTSLADEAARLLARIAAEHGPAVLASSFGAEDMVLIDVIAREALPIGIFTLDTGRLPEETHALMQRVRDEYRLPVTVYAPDAQAVEALVATRGTNGFYASIEARKACCGVRKTEPLARALAGKKAWITGLRRAQSTAEQIARPHQAAAHQAEGGRLRGSTQPRAEHRHHSRTQREHHPHRCRDSEHGRASPRALRLQSACRQRRLGNAGRLGRSRQPEDARLPRKESSRGLAWGDRFPREVRNFFPSLAPEASAAREALRLPTFGAAGGWHNGCYRRAQAAVFRSARRRERWS